MTCKVDRIVAMPMSDSIGNLVLGQLHQNATDDDAGLLESVLPTTVAAALTPLLAWALLVVCGTLSKGTFLENLSIRKSIAELTFARNGRLDVLDVIRVVAIFWVMINHTGSEGRVDVLEGLPSAQIFKSSIHDHPIFGALLGNSALGVEIFLVLSGLLACISWIRRADQPFWSHYSVFLLRRWLRLFPSIATFLFIATGPIIKTTLPRYHTTMISTCGVNGIMSHLTFLGNWQETPTCMGYLWYMGLDMQLYILAPFLMQLLYSSPRKAIISASLITAVSAFIRAAYCTVYGVCNNSDVDIPFIAYPGQDPSTVAHIYAGLWEMYARPYTKCGPFLIGILLGYCIHRTKISISDRSSRLILTSATALAVATVYGILPEYWNPNQGNTLYNTLYTALFRTVFSAAIALIIASLVLREKRVSVWNTWSVLARLTFNAYLLHMPIIYIFNHLPFLQTATTPYELLAIMPFVAALSFVASFLFHVFIESPLGRVSNALLKSVL